MKKFMEKNINKIGDSYQYEFSFSQSDVNTFAEISGDKNPIHLDEEYASKSMFKKRIIHGFLGGCIFSKVFGTLFPGEGTLYLKQTMFFYKPMFTDHKYIAKFKVTNIYAEKNRAEVSTEIVDENEHLIIKGEALIQNDKIKFIYQ